VEGSEGFLRNAHAHLRLHLRTHMCGNIAKMLPTFPNPQKSALLSFRQPFRHPSGLE
jgi:hypothetical protein